ncbi:bacterial lipocalin [Owenweeksia hongkongensis DSM 17368]|uniref:Bacterial lipocalin n=1 Tax=Owenweeksia hongkongensis (strain DSM 17368 / CIP 108786 / JCM 12287 / NRRL B-23963 / UST20020801) TaxID=926562 RepID=G8R261_OWEHD|nr:lipocalin family protein [Owenweeksia hongkongensis]AEV31811.1 bacterial lipocalin [Owenweeksia hongkongensis DSM 17368]
MEHSSILNKILTALGSLMLLMGCSVNQPLETAKDVSLEKYQGVWYDIAHLPQKLQDDCRCVTAEYTLKDGFVEVFNTCYNKESGQVSTITGKATTSTESGDNSQLQVQFFWPFKGDYYIIKIEPNYSYAMVGAPDRESLWILCREPQPAAVKLKEYLNLAEELGFNTSNLVYTDQSCYNAKELK